MLRQIVNSSDIRAIGYDSDNRILEIEFTSGGIYQYFNVPETVYEELVAAGSHGKYFHQSIKNHYSYEKIN